MRRSTFKILFYVNKQRMKEGRIPVYARLTVNGKSTFVNCRVTLPPALWDSKANKAAGKSHEAQTVNRKLEHIRTQSTYRKYDNVRKRLAEFLHEKLHREDIPLKELTETFITDYDLYLRGEKGLTLSCVCIYTKPLKTIVTKAHNVVSLFP